MLRANDMFVLLLIDCKCMAEEVYRDIVFGATLLLAAWCPFAFEYLMLHLAFKTYIC